MTLHLSYITFKHRGGKCGFVVLFNKMEIPDKSWEPTKFDVVNLN